VGQPARRVLRIAGNLLKRCRSTALGVQLSFVNSSDILTRRRKRLFSRVDNLKTDRAKAPAYPASEMSVAAVFRVNHIGQVSGVTTAVATQAGLCADALLQFINPSL
jgi:hypothetical protein